MLREGQRHWIRTVQFQSGEQFMPLYDTRDGLPVPWTTRYSAIFRRTGQGSVSTMEQELRAIAVALNWTEDRGINQEERIDGCAFITPKEALFLRDALRVNLNAAADGLPVNPTTHYNRCLYVRDYIVWRGQRVVQRIPNDDARFLLARMRLEEFRRSMSGLLLKPKPRGREGMPAAAAERLREVLHPDNPFQSGQLHLNRALILFYLDLGVRLSEALVVKGADLNLHGDRIWKRLGHVKTKTLPWTRCGRRPKPHSQINRQIGAWGLRPQWGPGAKPMDFLQMR